jgi:hypothetical protein
MLYVSPEALPRILCERGRTTLLPVGGARVTFLDE